ncbi:nucleotidyltransferase domain-containing protein [Candidatus Pacearchaeota archaeon]|nr:nucleotidyltransferase domain-containing protein [Candidatus Pacearchaeota archaeon]
MELIKAIKKPEMRRIFGERELKIIEKQLKGVNLLPSEKTRLSRDIRKKFEAVRILSDFIEDFKLKKGLYLKEIIEEAKNKILIHNLSPKIRKITLFGTAAENRLRLGSDIDIAVEFSRVNSEEAVNFRMNIMSQVRENIDVQVYNILPKEVKDEIDRKGKIIFERKN